MIRSGVIVAFFTFISRIFGLIRELFIASALGTSIYADSINVACKLPNLFRRIFGEGALSVAFIPIFTKKYNKNTEEAKEFSSKIFVLLSMVLVVLVVLMEIYMPSVMYIIAPGFYKDQEKFYLTVALSRISMPYLIFISIVSLCGGMLNSIGKFAAQAFSPVILSICIIIAVSLSHSKIEIIHNISYAMLIAGILQTLLIFRSLHISQLFFSLSFPKVDIDIKKFFKNMIPAVLSSGAIQIHLFISQSIATLIPGTISVLSYADRVYQFPLSIIGITFGTILLPELSRLQNQDNSDVVGISNIQLNATKISIALSLPCALGLVILAHKIVHMLYQHGAFTAIDASKVSDTVIAFALGLPAFTLIRVFTPIFYANHDTNTPFKATIYSLIVNTLLNIALIMPFKHIGIAWASTITAWVNLLLLIIFLRKANYLLYSLRHLISFVLKIFSCVFVMCVVINYLSNKCSEFFHLGLHIEILTILFIVIIGIGVYGLCLYILGIINNHQVVRFWTKLNSK